MTQTFRQDFPATLEELSHVRQTLGSWLAEEAVDNRSRTDLLSVASEFFVHVVVRTGGLGRARMAAERRPDGVRLSVTAAPPERLELVRRLGLPADPLINGSLGRRLVEGCCDDLKVLEGAGEVRAECWRSVQPA
jgi:anti-sigma regulatory factor (Ser/Thr protein kinase)